MPRTWRGAPPTTASTIGGARRVDMKRVKARKDAIVAHSRDGRRDAGCERRQNCTVYHGPRPLRLAARGRGRRRAAARAEHIFINVGGRASVPAHAGHRSGAVSHQHSMMDLDFLPRHLVVVGGSYIGLEFGQMFRRFGSEVTIVEMAPRLDRARGRGRFRRDRARSCENEGIARSAQRHVHPLSPGAATASPSASTAPRRAGGRRLASAARRRPPPQHRRSRPRQGRRRRRQARLHRRRRPAAHQRARHLGARRLQRQAAPSPTPPTTTTRSSPPTCSTTTRAASATASPPTRSTSIRRSAAPA